MAERLRSAASLEEEPPLVTLIRVTLVTLALLTRVVLMLASPSTGVRPPAAWEPTGVAQRGEA